MSTQAPERPPLVRFGRMQSKGVLLGLSGPRLTAIGLALTCLVIPMFSAGLAGLVVSAPLWAGFAALGLATYNGRGLADQVPVLAHWSRRVAAKQTRYRVRASAPRPAGTMALPGDAAALRFHHDPISGAVMVHDPRRQTLMAAVRIRHPAYVLLSPGDQAQRLAGWSRVLASFAATGTCAAVQIMESTLPDPGHGVRGWHAEHGVHDGSWACRAYETLLDLAAPSSAGHRTLIVVSLDLRRAAKAIRDGGRGIAGAAKVLRGDMTGVESSLRAASLTVEGWLSAAELAVVIRQAYDPSAGRMRPDDPGSDLATAGPAAVQEQWDHLRHDSGYSTVLWISEWPRIDVPPHFLHSLVFAQGVRKTISIVARPLPPGEALRKLRKEKVEYVTEATQKAKIGRIADLADEQEYSDVLDRERALISGHADMRFSGFVAVTASTLDELRASVATIERAAQQCGCETRTLFGQQSQAFTVAALPLARTVN
jgi:hypothetical protein